MNLTNHCRLVEGKPQDLSTALHNRKELRLCMRSDLVMKSPKAARPSACNQVFLNKLYVGEPRGRPLREIARFPALPAVIIEAFTVE